ncbi:MAG: caspase family protein, partial [Acidobacteriota bacterium]
MRKSFLIVVFGLILLANTIPASTSQQDQTERTVTVQPIRSVPKDKRWALIIGIDKYEDSSITPLSGADNDARSLRDALVRYCGFDKEQIITLTSDSSTDLQPKRANILTRLANLRNVVPPDGFLIVSYSGHGIERNGNAFLLPMDVRGINDASLLEDTAISIKRVTDYIRTTGTKQLMVMIDACRNDPAAGKGDADNQLTTGFADGFD